MGYQPQAVNAGKSGIGGSMYAQTIRPGYMALSSNGQKLIFPNTLFGKMMNYSPPNPNNPFGAHYNSGANFKPSPETSARGSLTENYDTLVLYDRSTGQNAVMRSLANIDADARHSKSKSLDTAVANLQKQDIPGKHRQSIRENLVTSEHLGRILLKYVHSEESKELFRYLAKRGHSEGIEYLFVMDEDTDLIAATNPKQKPDNGFILYNRKAAHEYRNFLKNQYGHLEDEIITNDYFAHEISHSFLHGPQVDKLQAEMDVEKALTVVYSKMARDARDSGKYGKQAQYERMASQHIDRYISQAVSKTLMGGRHVNIEALKQELFEAYQAEYGLSSDNGTAEAPSGAAGHGEAHSLEAIVAESTE